MTSPARLRPLRQRLTRAAVPGRLPGFQAVGSPAYEPMSAELAARFNDLYLAFLHRRDGRPDLATQTFDVREKFFAELDREPVLWVGPSLIPGHARARAR
jgi:hypothetical protein